MAKTGVRNVGETEASRPLATGEPPSREKAKSIREVEVTVASPQRNCAPRMPA